MNDKKTSTQIHEELRHRLKELGWSDEEIQKKLSQLDSFILESIIQEKLNSLDKAIYKEFERLVEVNAPDDEIAKLIRIDDNELHQKIRTKLEEVVKSEYFAVTKSDATAPTINN